MARGKRYENALKQIDRSKLYAPDEALKMIHGMATAKFDETIELHFRLGIDPRHADQQVRGAGKRRWVKKEAHQARPKNSASSLALRVTPQPSLSRCIFSRITLNSEVEAR